MFWLSRWRDNQHFELWINHQGSIYHVSHCKMLHKIWKLLLKSKVCSSFCYTKSTTFTLCYTANCYMQTVGIAAQIQKCLSGFTTLKNGQKLKLNTVNHPFRKLATASKRSRVSSLHCRVCTCMLLAIFKRIPLFMSLIQEDLPVIFFFFFYH